MLSCYRAMDFLLEALDDLQETVFFTAADLPLDVDLILFDTTSTYFEFDFEDSERHEDQDHFRLRGHSKDFRPDLPPVVIGMAVTTGGLPVRLWVWPGNTTDASVLEQVKDDLAGWQLNRNTSRTVAAVPAEARQGMGTICGWAAWFVRVTVSGRGTDRVNGRLASCRGGVGAGLRRGPAGRAGSPVLRRRRARRARPAPRHLRPLRR